MKVWKITRISKIINRAFTSTKEKVITLTPFPLTFLHFPSLFRGPPFRFSVSHLYLAKIENFKSAASFVSNPTPFSIPHLKPPTLPSANTRGGKKVKIIDEEKVGVEGGKLKGCLLKTLRRLCNMRKS